jgi:predicted dehydrogenase
MGAKHLAAFETSTKAEVVAVYSRDERKLRGDLSGIQGNLGGPGGVYDFSGLKKYKSLDAVVDDHDIDAVDICLPTDLHAEVAIAALCAGKDVLLEKPMALDVASSRRIIHSAEANSRILMVAHVLRFFPEYQALFSFVDSGEWGQVRSATFRRRCAAPAWSGWLSNPAQSGGGAFDLLIHDVDVCLKLFGLPEAVSAFGYEALASGIDVLSARLHYPQSLDVEVTGGWHHPKSFPFSMGYTVVLDEGTIEYEFETRPPSAYGKNGEQTPFELSGQDGYRAEIDYFLQCCVDRQFPSLCPPVDSARAVGLMNLISQSRSGQGNRIVCNL